MTLPSLSRQQLLDGYRSLHANDAELAPVGVNYHRTHGTPFLFEATMNRFAGQNSQALLSEAETDAQKKGKSGRNRLWAGETLLLLGCTCILGPAEFLVVNLPALVLGAYQLFKCAKELKLASDDRNFIAAVQSLSNPNETPTGDGQPA